MVACILLAGLFGVLGCVGVLFVISEVERG